MVADNLGWSTSCGGSGICGSIAEAMDERFRFRRRYGLLALCYARLCPNRILVGSLLSRFALLDFLGILSLQICSK